ncbi:MAG TPA: ATP-binding protein, partial [Verrucomicrobiae bacterium]|nr:ATP-binding protein [Verrucomicrobiae bacterium]
RPEEWASALALRGGEPVLGQFLKIRRFDGAQAFVHNSAAPVRDSAGEIVGSAVAVMDVTDLTVAHDRVQRQNAILEGMNGIFQSALSAESDEELGAVCLRVAEVITGSSCGFLGETNEDGFFHDIAVSDPGWEACSMHDRSGHRSFALHGIYGRVLTSGTPFYTNEPDTEPGRAGTPEGHPPIRCFLGAPLVLEGRTVGMVAVANRPGGYGGEQLEALESLAPIIVEAFQRRRGDQALREARDAAEKANSAKSQFLANMSHELRTPMTGVLGMLELALEGRLDEEQRSYLQMASKSAGSLVRIINDILDLTKIEAGKLSIEERPFSLADCVSESVEIMVPEARRKGITLSCTVAEGIPSRVLGDHVRLRQVLTNLVGNAVKFTDDGRVEVEVRGEPGKGGVREYVLTVSDTGIGIPENKTDRLFRSFSQMDDSDTRRHGGAGLGLVISRQIVERMGGSIVFRSREGGGSSFIVRLPLRDSAEEPAMLLPAAPPADTGSSRRILVVEDDPLVSRLVETFLVKREFVCLLAGNGLEGVEQWEKGGVDLILMDIQMPVMDGFAATDLIRRREEQTGSHVPVVAFTARAMKEEEERIRRAGFDDYVTKPVDLASLLAVLHK